MDHDQSQDSNQGPAQKEGGSIENNLHMQKPTDTIIPEKDTIIVEAEDNSADFFGKQIDNDQMASIN